MVHLCGRSEQTGRVCLGGRSRDVFGRLFLVDFLLAGKRDCKRGETNVVGRGCLLLPFVLWAAGVDKGGVVRGWFRGT